MKTRIFPLNQVLKDATDCVTKVKITDHEILTSSLDCRIRRYDIRAGELIEDYIGGDKFSFQLSSITSSYTNLKY